MPIPLCSSIKEAQVIDLPKQTKHRGTWPGQMLNDSLLLVRLKDVKKMSKDSLKGPKLESNMNPNHESESITCLPATQVQGLAHNAVGSSHSGGFSSEAASVPEGPAFTWQM